MGNQLEQLVEDEEQARCSLCGGFPVKDCENGLVNIRYPEGRPHRGWGSYAACPNRLEADQDVVVLEKVEIEVPMRASGSLPCDTPGWVLEHATTAGE